MSERIDQILEAILEYNMREIRGLVQSAIDEGLDLDQIVAQGLIRAMDIIGDRFSKEDIFVPEMLAAAKTMKTGLEVIRPHLKGLPQERGGKVIIGTVKGDLHDIGKNLAAMMLEGAGFEVVDLGVDVSAEVIVQKVHELRPEVVALSALLTTTLPEMEKVIAALAAGGVRETVKIIIGGAPVDEKHAQKIGADGYGEDAAQAVHLTRRLLQA